jgi:hypothetical protein
MTSSLPRKEEKVFCPGRKGWYLGGHCFGQVSHIIWDKSGDSCHEVVVRFNDQTLETFYVDEFDDWSYAAEWWKLRVYDEGEASTWKFPKKEGVHDPSRT